MSTADNQYFDLLKKRILETMQRSYPGINPDISAWKGQEITDFQEELLAAVNAHVSEKWFYTHMKTERTSLPRIDVLNLLSRYAGYVNWDDFIFRNSEPGSKTLLTAASRRQPGPWGSGIRHPSGQAGNHLRGRHHDGLEGLSGRDHFGEPASRKRLPFTVRNLRASTCSRAPA